MKAFALNLFKFSLPVIIVMVSVEVFLSVEPGIFKVKSDYIHQNLDSIAVLVLGSSHTKDAINPELIALKTANLAYGGQSLHLDSKLLFTFINKLPNLKVVFIELNYHSLEYDNDENNWRNSLYYKYYGVTEKMSNKPNLNQYSLYLSNPDFYHHYLFDYFSPYVFHEKLNKAGFVVAGQQDRFQEYSFDTLLIEQTRYPYLKERHKNISLDAFEKNGKIVANMIDACEQRGIQVVLLSTPLYKTYVSEMIDSKSKRRKDFKTMIKKRYPKLNDWDFERIWVFDAMYFKNDDHLNTDGAVKFTRIINDSLKVKFGNAPMQHITK